MQHQGHIQVQGNKREAKLLAKLFVEFLGTLAFVFFGAGTASHPNVELVAVSAAHGVVTMILVFLFADISGAHFNAGPTLVFGLYELATRRYSKSFGFKVLEMVLYLIVQAAGAVVGGFMVYSIYGSDSTLGTPALAPTVSTRNGVLIEFFGTTFLMLVINMVSKQPLSVGAPAIGAMLFVIFLVGAPLDGAAMNPWRWLGPAVASNQFASYWWIYTVGPISGFAFGFILFHIINKLYAPQPALSSRHDEESDYSYH